MFITHPSARLRGQNCLFDTCVWYEAREIPRVPYITGVGALDVDVAGQIKFTLNWNFLSLNPNNIIHGLWIIYKG